MLLPKCIFDSPLASWDLVTHIRDNCHLASDFPGEGLMMEPRDTK